MLAVVHAETSTGVRNPVADIGKLITALPCLYLVDTVTSLGGIEITQDAWHIDALYSSTQKCLSCPPGLDDLGLEMLVDSFFRLPMLKALRETL
ncbi:MAG: aminotransferase class V-fold PLP-dependent enzyme [Pseudomonadota bacterium]|nr:aminotransferase class V-fold PLP-dependent enzyme [Pseudomonadota bacterium]